MLTSGSRVEVYTTGHGFVTRIKEKYSVPSSSLLLRRRCRWQWIKRQLTRLNSPVLNRTQMRSSQVSIRLQTSSVITSMHAYHEISQN